jgi:hypothetical protein
MMIAGFSSGDLVRFRKPQTEYERSAIFVVLENRGPRTAVRDISLTRSEHNGTLLQRGWTVYATSDLEMAR